MANYNCNSTAPVYIAHHFLGRLRQSKQKGAIFFTSSPAGAIVQPMFSMYGATKAFLTSWASSIAAEVHGTTLTSFTNIP
jgi:short-subunit dehydrogenase